VFGSKRGLDQPEIREPLGDSKGISFAQQIACTAFQRPLPLRGSMRRQRMRTSKPCALRQIVLAHTVTSATLYLHCTDLTRRSKQFSRHRYESWITTYSIVSCMLWLSSEQIHKRWRNRTSGLRVSRKKTGDFRLLLIPKRMPVTCVKHED
jgi:hypothetical protein